MDLCLTADEQALADAMGDLLKGRFPIEDVRAAEETGTVIDRGRWRELGDMGVFSLRADGAGVREAVLVFEQLGRALVPGPLVATHLAAGLVEGAATGATVVGLLDLRPAATIVEHAGELDALLCFDGHLLRRVDPLALDLIAATRPLDPLTPVWRCTGGATSGQVIAEGESVVELHRVGIVLTAAQQLGLALAAVELATAYASQRVQFGRPIGSFQAVKHLLADMLVAAEVARAGVYAAACTLDGAGDADPDRAASAAKIVAGEAALFAGKTGIQVHGGMGFTWAVDAQRYWKRAVVLDNTFGSVDHHAAAIADGL